MSHWQYNLEFVGALMNRIGFMRFVSYLALLVAALLLAGPVAAETTPATLNFPTQGVTEYGLEEAFPGVTFSQPITMTTPPGETDRIFIGEKRGILWVIPDLDNPTKEIFLNLRELHNIPVVWEAGLLGVAFHPDYANNGYFYVYYCPYNDGDFRRNRVSRFQVSADDPNRADPASEVIYINQYDQGEPFHDAGDMHFGDDGYLYFANGDHGGGNDEHNVSQQIDLDYFSGIFRIDVDKRPGSLEPNDHPSVYRETPGAPANYAVPPDNPWVGATEFNGQPVDPDEVVMEYYAIGLRNPYRWSFHPQTGDMWIGDVGQSAQEEINVGTAGDNFGWAFREGSVDGPKIAQAPPEFVETPPIHTYPRSDGRAIIGGIVYDGDVYPELSGAYLFADFLSGNIWALRYDGESATTKLLAQQSTVAEFDVHPKTGEILMSVHDSGSIKKLVHLGDSEDALPPTLEETGAFASVENLTPAAGVIPYSPNVSFWSDHAIKQRWFSLPGAEPFGYGLNEPWTKPVGSVFVKHFELETVRGDPASRRRIETRFMVMSDFGAYGVSYEWDEDGETASLAPSDGVDVLLDIIDEEGQPSTQTWRIPSRSQCLECHTRVADFALSFDARQLNGEGHSFGEAENVIRALMDNGYLADGPTDEALARMLPHAPADDLTASLNQRARSYLAVNCASCHQAGGPTPAAFDVRPHLTLRETGLINGAVGNDTGGEVTPDHRLVVPGDPEHSVLLQRLCACDGFTRMPPLASNEIDEAGVALITEWILSLDGYQTLESWLETHFPGQPEIDLQADADFDGQSNAEEFELGTDPNNPRDYWRPLITAGPGEALAFEFLAPPHIPLVIEESTDLVHWTPWGPPFVVDETELRSIEATPEAEPLFLRVINAE